MPSSFIDSPPNDATITEEPGDGVQERERLGIGSTVVSRYKVVARLSKGTFGHVYEGEDTYTKKPVALKVLMAKHSNIALREKRSLWLLNKDECKYVARMLEFLVLDEWAMGHQPKHVIIFPKYEENLYQYSRAAQRAADSDTRGLSYRIQKQALTDLLRGLVFIHEHGLMHLDIKPENIVLNKTNPRPNWTIIDFGNSERNHQLDVYYEAVTPWYRAPEICVGAKYTEKADMWSVGCIIYEIEAGTPLFSVEGSARVLQRHFEELGAPPNEFMNLSLPPRTTTLTHVERGPDGEIVYAGAPSERRRRGVPTLSRTWQLKKHCLACLRWMPSERPSAKTLLTCIEQEVAE